MGTIIHACCSFNRDQSNSYHSDSGNQIENKPKSKPHYASPRPSYMHYNKPFESTSISLSETLKKKLQFLENDSAIAVNELTSPIIYAKMLMGESLSLIINVISSYEVMVLIEIIVKTYAVTKKLMCKEDLVNLHDNYVNSMEPIVNEMEKKFIEGKMYIENEYKNDLLGMICDLVEVFHFFKYNISGGKDPYIEFYWMKYQNVEGHIKEKIREMQGCLIDINKKAKGGNEWK